MKQAGKFNQTTTTEKSAPEVEFVASRESSLGSSANQIARYIVVWFEIWKGFVLTLKRPPFCPS